MLDSVWRIDQTYYCPATSAARKHVHAAAGNSRIAISNYSLATNCLLQCPQLVRGFTG